MPASALSLPAFKLGDEGVAGEASAASLSAEEDSDREACDDPDLPKWLERTFASSAATLPCHEMR